MNGPLTCPKCQASTRITGVGLPDEFPCKVIGNLELIKWVIPVVTVSAMDMLFSDCRKCLDLILIYQPGMMLVKV